MVGSKTASQIAAIGAARNKQPSPEEINARREAALEEAHKAEEEAANTAKERDVAADRVREALKRAALVCAEAAHGDPDHNRDNKSHVSEVAAPDDALHQAMLAHKAAAVVNLHHHAAGVQNIRNLVHVILDLTDDNYKHWRDRLLLVTGKYSKEYHILSNTPAPDFPD
jgi:hypothetical protein